MNFSMNRNSLKKSMSILLATAMMSTLLSGCFGGDEPTEPTTPLLTLPTAPVTEPTTAATETEPTQPDEDMATVLNELYIRRSPSESAPEMGTLKTGEKVEIIDTQEALGVTWGLIKVPNSDKEGWICMDYVQWSQKPSQPEDETSNQGGSNENKPADTTVVARGTVTASTLHIRREPTTTAESVGSLDNGDRVEILEKKNNWGRIKEGWISLDHVKLDSTTTGGDTSGNNNTTNKPSTGNGSTKVISRGVVYNTDNLNIRSGPSVEDDRVGGLSGGDRVEIYEKSGNWGRIDKGWISLGYVYIDGSGIGDNRYGTVTADELNIRSGPGTQYDSVGSLSNGDDVTILFRVKKGDTTWGNIKQGWISMDYVDLDDEDEDDDTQDSNIDSDGNTKVVFRGVVTADDLNIRRSPDSDSTKVGSYSYGDRVEILEEDDNWGRTKKGWINLDYVYADGTGDGGDWGTANEGLNIRSGPGTKYNVVGGLEKGDEVEILFEVDVDGTSWGNVDDGWVCMDYIDMD